MDGPVRPYRPKQSGPLDLGQVYRATTALDAEHQLSAFAAQWDDKYPTIAVMWRRHWDRVIPFFEYPAEIRRVINMTNAFESLPFPNFNRNRTFK